ncbi:uncharacterized protein LOC132726735 [Ruditapes philippinarum]|uniref:uncharacterized protein LOC132726735 n=1 Tax=Ruditapes philippinarum TaxID=129788 RepID=UPI00295AC38A|nr:uncharacterized protein LOC132726735 [Ruditapes philippinarum]
MVSECKHHQCDKRQRCSPLGNGAYKCVNITCDHTRHVNGDDQSGTSIAGTNSSYVLTCPDNMFLSGDTSITCLLNGEWSVPEATCMATTIGTACTSNSDCNESEAICNQGYCFCNRFYRYDPDSKECMKVCTVLTNSFSFTKGMRVAGFNDRGFSPQTFTDCQTLCIDDTDCVSFEYNTESGRCRRSSLSKQMVQDALPDFILYDNEKVDFYDRECL